MLYILYVLRLEQTGKLAILMHRQRLHAISQYRLCPTKARRCVIFGTERSTTGTGPVGKTSQCDRKLPGSGAVTFYRPSVAEPQADVGRSGHRATLPV